MDDILTQDSNSLQRVLRFLSGQRLIENIKYLITPEHH